ncbi:integrin alpha-8-like [Mytilus californianus]|uniref:integrin alpha-8-like n=1 Tax=Mytilus californianus TaxID=6549 RepID=UPI002246EA9F|nr:integrin alpha-8-like [Mytilus californianus]
MNIDGLFWLSFFVVVNSFNVDVKNTLTFSGPEKSYFGYSGILQDNWMMIGAPKDNLTSESSLVSPGVVYRCPVDFTVSTVPQCTQLPISTSETHTQDNQFLGGSMVDINGNIVVCAHLWKFPGFVEYTVGRCHVIKRTNVDTNRGFPFTSSDLYSRNGYIAAFGMIGFSIARSKKRPVAILGAPGMNDKGGYVSFNVSQSGYHIYKAEDGQDTKSFEQQSYMGYSIAVGHFSGLFSCNNDHILMGMPSFASSTDGHVGSVVLVCGFDLNMDISKQFFGKQIGSGFGYNVIVCDYNGDGKDDIMVAAPFQYLERNPVATADTGAVYIFLGTGNMDILNPINATLSGDNIPGGRFGTSMVNLGDINADGVDDIAIAAPYEASGVVYIYSGKSGEVKMKYSQKIYGKNIDSGMKNFGLFISNSHDMDSNLYSDFTIGSPIANKMILFRSRPVVVVTPRMQILPSPIPLNSSALDCSDGTSVEPCTSVTLCFSFNGTKLDSVDKIEVNYHLHADTDRTKQRKSNRVLIVHNSTAVRELYRQKLIITKGGQVCDMVHIRVTAADRQFFASLEDDMVIQMNYSLQEDSISGQVLPVLNPISKTIVSGKAKFQTGCKGQCNPDLVINLQTQQHNIVHGQTKQLIITVVLENRDEPAFAPNVIVKQSNNTRYVAYRALLQRGSVPVVCEEVMDNTTISCNCGNVLYQQQKAIFHLIFDVSIESLHQGDLNSTDILLNVELNVVARVPAGVDNNIGNNAAQLAVPIEFHSLVQVTGKSQPEQGFVSFPTNNLSFIHTYEVYNTGPSPMVTSRVFIALPQYKNTERVLYGSSIKIGTSSNTTDCILLPINNSTLNPNINDGNVITTPSSTGSTVTPVKDIVCDDIYDIRCLHIRCSLQRLAVDRSTRITVLFQLDATKFRFIQEQSVYFTTTAYVFPAETDFPFELLRNDTTKVTSILYPAKTEHEVESINLWIIVGGVLAGVILLLIIGLVMWKVGFFKRKKREQVNEYKRKSNYYEKRKTQRLEIARSKALSKVMSRSDEVTLVKRS